MSTKNGEFYPPLLNPLLVRICQSFSYLSAHLLYKIDLKISPTCLEKLKTLDAERLVLMPNHPTFDDGIVLFLLSTRLGEIFNYLVAYESFFGLQAQFLQLMGAYSIKRGIGDRHSIAQTIEILRKPAARLVIFPEGGCSFQNDTVMPFRSGAIQIPFQALKKIAKQQETIPNLYLVPLSIKYRYIVPMEEIIDRTLITLENQLEITTKSIDYYQRLRIVAAKIIATLEQEYGLNNSWPNSQDWNQRIAALKERALATIEEKLNLHSYPESPLRERVYKVQYFLDSQPDFPEQKLIKKSIFRLLNFDAIYDGYVASFPTGERFLDTLTRLEREVFSIDKPVAKAHRQAVITVGKPVNLKDYFPDYQANRMPTVESLTEKIQQAVQKNLDLLATVS